MTITISQSVGVYLAFMAYLVVTWIKAAFFTRNFDGLEAFFLVPIVGAFATALLFAGAYFKWWLL